MMDFYKFVLAGKSSIINFDTSLLTCILITECVGVIATQPWKTNDIKETVWGKSGKSFLHILLGDSPRVNDMGLLPDT